MTSQQHLHAQSLQHSTQRAYALLAQAEHKHSDADRAEALALLEPCPDALAPDLTVGERALLGACWVRAGQPQRALPYLDFDWLDAEPRAAGLAGSALLSLGAVAPALGALQRAAESPACEPAIRINLGRALLMVGEAEAALPQLEQGRAGLPGQTLAELSVAEALLALGRVDDALAQIPEKPEDEPLIAARVHLLGAASRHAEAAELLRETREMYPDSLPLLLLGAELADVRGRSGEAYALLKKALEKEPDNIALWARLAQTGRKGMPGPFAREAADKALALAAGKAAPVRALALNAHAHVLAEEIQVEQAEAAYREALTLVPGYTPALSGLGHLLMQNGKVAEAMECFNQVRAVAPLQGWSQLIHAREVPQDPKVLEDMERAAHQPGLEGPVRSSLLYTVAAAWDKKKEYDRAMTLAREANEASKKLLTYDPAAHRQRVEREIARFSANFMQSRTGWGHPSRLPVFVLGMPRSGTTLTEQILGSHSHVFGAGELGLVGEQIARLEGWERHVGSRLHYPECVADLGRERSQKLAQDWLERLQSHDPQARHVVDKLPHNFEHIGLIKLLFPNAIIFHCRREARDIAVSNYITDYAAKFGGMGFAYDLGWIGEQLVDHDRLMQHWHEVFPGQIMEVVYEDLVEDTEAWARRMIDFMGLEWEPGVLEFKDLERPVKTASVWQVRQPVYTTSKARWKRYEAHLGPLEDALKIVPPMPNASPLPKLDPGLFGVGMAHLHANRPAEAEACYLQVIAAYPEHAAAYHFLGAALLQQGKAPKAVRAMREALRLLPVHPSWWENLARAEHAAGNEEGAKKAWARGQQLRQRQAEARQAQQLPVAQPATQ
jgi:tetratricopeptide (TPR) repeat protein